MTLTAYTWVSCVKIPRIPDIHVYAWSTSTSLDLSWSNTPDISGGIRGHAQKLKSNVKHRAEKVSGTHRK